MNYKPRRTKDQWQTILDEHKDSGLTVKAFCEQKTINYSSFTKWKHLLKTGTRVKKNPAALIKLGPPEKTSAQAGHQTLTYTSATGGTLSWGPDVNPNYIASILGVL